MVRNVSAVWAGAGLLVASSVMGVEAQDSSEWSGRLEPGQTLEVKGITGVIRAVTASGGTAEVLSEKRGRSSDFDEVEIRVVEERDRVVVCAVYGSWNQGNDCDYDGDNNRRRDRDDNDGIDVSVDFDVRVPAGVELVGSLVTGDIIADDLQSDIKANTVTGDIDVTTSRVAWARTVTGQLDIEMTGSDWDELSYSTVTGDITVYLPQNTDADVRFESISGDFDTEFAVVIESARRRFVGSQVHGTIGDGGRRLSFKTVSGDVELRRSRAR